MKTTLYVFAAIFVIVALCLLARYGYLHYIKAKVERVTHLRDEEKRLTENIDRLVIKDLEKRFFFSKETREAGELSETAKKRLDSTNNELESLIDLVKSTKEEIQILEDLRFQYARDVVEIHRGMLKPEESSPCQKN